MVEAPAGERQAPAHRADVHDLAPALGAHPGQHHLGQRDRAEHVRLELPPHGLQRNLLDRAALRVAGVVDEHADGALGALDLINRGAHRVLVGHVERERAAAGVLQVLDRLQPAGARVDGPAAGGQAARGRLADAGGAAGDQHRL